MEKKLSTISWIALSSGKFIGIIGIAIGYSVSPDISMLFSGIGSGLYIFCDMEQQRQRGVE